MEYLQKTVDWINAALSDYVLTVLLIGCGVFFSIRTRFVQFRCFGEGFRNALGGSRGGGRRSGITPFQSLMAAVAVGFIFCGTLMKSEFVWELQDLMNQLMVLPNVLALIALSGMVAAAARRQRS